MTKKELVKRRYIRNGKCIRCGACCLVEDCPYLKWKEGKAFCSIYRKRPNKCRWFPQAPPIIFKTCGYFFIDTWQDNRIIKPGEI